MLSRVVVVGVESDGGGGVEVVTMRLDQKSPDHHLDTATPLL